MKEGLSAMLPEVSRIGMDGCGRPLVTLCLSKDSVLGILWLLSLVYRLVLILYGVL